MATLKDEQKLFIVQCLACYDTPTQVVEAVKDEFGLTLERPQIQSYDPTKVQGRDLSKKYREIFDATRKAFLDDISKIPIASQSFRLRSLQRMHDYAVSKKNYVMAAEILEQAAKEVGGVFTNKVKLGGDAENPLTMLLQQVNGSALPINHAVEGEFTTVEESATTKESAPAKKKRPPMLLERD
jgi:hypothetical protein